MTPSYSRIVWVLTAVAVAASLLWLDAHRAGPASELSTCNLALSRSDAPPADVLVVGSSRTGVAIDPVAMQAMLDAAGLDDPTVERIAIGRNPLRANSALIENYLRNRGAPAVIVLELSFLTERTVERIGQISPGTSADTFLYRRDVNLIDFGQITTTPAVARPFSAPESSLNRLRYGLEGVMSRIGALAYQLASEPGGAISADDCTKELWTREVEWPADFAFSWDDAETVAPPADRISALRTQIAQDAPGRELKPWQLEAATGIEYPYDFDEQYRLGEMRLLDEVVDRAATEGVPVVLLPMTVYGTKPNSNDLDQLSERFGDDARVFDLYASVGVDLSTYWYDDAHLEVGAATELTTAALAQHLLDDDLLDDVLVGEIADRSDS